MINVTPSALPSYNLLRDMIAYKLRQSASITPGTQQILTLSKAALGPLYEDICKYLSFNDRRTLALHLVENVYGYTIIRSSVNSNNQTLRITYTLLR